MGFAIPRKLSDAFAEKRVILFVGAGMSMPQLPGWEKLLREMLASEVDGRAAAILKAETRIRSCIDKHQFLEAASLLRAGMGPRDFCEFLNQRLRSAKGDLRHRIAARLPLAAILTTNFDTFLEDAFGADRPDVLNQQKLPELMRGLQQRRFSVVHMHGEVTDSQS
jgi:NAD-dependent SIR2 family protein deacetylase